MLVTYCENNHQIQQAKEAGLSEVILGLKALSRFNFNSHEQFHQQAQLAKSLGLKVILEWDIFMTENKMVLAINNFKSLDLDLVDSIRVQDLGALEYVLKKTNKKIQLIAEGKNHNLNSLLHYKDYCGERLERYVLSLELTKEKLQAYKETLKLPIEFLVLGRILLFYTPRNLLSALELKEYQDQIIATGESEESPHKGFPLIENSHGTFMFHIKHQYLLDQFKEIGFIDYLRVDLRFDGEFSLINELNKLYREKNLHEFDKSLYKFETIRGFFKINKSNVLFKKLKNQKVQRNDANYIGEIIDAQKPSHLVIQIKNNSIQCGDEIKFFNPEGKEISLLIHQMKSLNGKDIQVAKKDEFAQIKYHSQLWVKSQAYK